jgi:hypothetical protein
MRDPFHAGRLEDNHFGAITQMAVRVVVSGLAIF